MVRADAQADEQVKVARGDAVGRGGAQDLVELVERVEAEGTHAVDVIRLGDRFGGLDRVHEAQSRLRQHLGDQPHFADRRDVVMRHLRIPQNAEQLG